MRFEIPHFDEIMKLSQQHLFGVLSARNALVTRVTHGVLLFALGGSGSSLRAAQSIARVWDERALASIRVDTPHPPAQARNLFSLSTCMYDAWAAYDTLSVGYVYHAKHTAMDVAAARREAISYAAYRMLKERHIYSKTATNTLEMGRAHV